MFVRAYLRASTKEQDAERARAQLEAFAAERGLSIAAHYVENESGAKLARPELFRLLSDAKPGDVLLVEQVDRLSRLAAADWERLKAEIAAKRVRVVALDLPTSWQLAKDGDSFTGRMLDALNGMMIDMLAAVARKDHDDRRRRQAQGIDKAKAEGRFKGRPEDAKRNAAIAHMLKTGSSWTQVQAATGCSRATIAKIVKRASVGAAATADQVAPAMTTRLRPVPPKAKEAVVEAAAVDPEVTTPAPAKRAAPPKAPVVSRKARAAAAIAERRT